MMASLIGHNAAGATINIEVRFSIPCSGMAVT